MPELSCTVGHHGRFSCGLVVKNLPVSSADVVDVGLIPGSGDFLEEEIGTNSSILVWEISWTEKLGRVQSMRSHKVRHGEWVHRTPRRYQSLAYCGKTFPGNWGTEYTFGTIYHFLILCFSLNYNEDKHFILTIWLHVFSSVQLLSYVRIFVTPWTAACQASLSITNSWSSAKLTSIESVMPSNHLILIRPLLLLPSIFPSIRGFSNESALRIRWSKYWSFSFSISPSNEHPGLISFRMDWLDLRAVQGTLKILLQHRSSKASSLWCSAFFIVQLSHPYMTTGKTIALTRQTFVDQVMSLLWICCIGWS